MEGTKMRDDTYGYGGYNHSYMDKNGRCEGFVECYSVSRHTHEWTSGGGNTFVPYVEKVEEITTRKRLKKSLRRRKPKGGE